MCLSPFLLPNFSCLLTLSLFLSILPSFATAKEEWKVLRGSWFQVVGDKWYPFMEEDSTMIEEEHMNKDWREAVKGLSVTELSLIIPL